MTIETVIQLIIAHSWLALASGLVLFIQHAISEHADWFPWINVSAKTRAIVVTALGLVAGGLDAATNWSTLGNPWLTQAILQVPSLLALMLSTTPRPPTDGAKPVGATTSTMFRAGKILDTATLCALSVVAGGCAMAKPACEVVRVADNVCTTLVLADGTKVALTREDVASPEHLAAALGRKGVVGCR